MTVSTQGKRPDLIDPARMPHAAMRASETYLRKQTFKVENALIVRLQALYWAAYRDLATLPIGASPSDQSARIAQRIDALRAAVLALLAQAVRAALTGGYYGKLWLLDVATQAHVPIAVQHSLGQWMNAAPDGSVLDDTLGKAVRAQVNIEFDALTVDVRRVLIGVVTNAGAQTLLRRLRTVMGVNQARETYHGNFNQVQVLARTAVQSANNTGSLTAMQANAPLIDALEWLTARDERVCPICAPLDGKRFPLNTIERPPIHPQCRCTLVPIIQPDALSSPTTPLRQTFPQWLLTIDVRGDVDGYLNP